MRAALAIVLLLLAVSCTPNGPAMRPSAALSPSPAHRVALTSGGVVEYPLPDPSAPGSSCAGCGRSSVSAVAAGADGNIWFADPGLGSVGRITPSGAVTELALPAGVGDPYAIAVGPDGNIWVTTSAGGGHPDWILRVGPGETITPFQAGTRTGGGFGTGPERITSGPDGNLWFTEFWSNRIGRMTPAGGLTEFPIPSPDSAPRGIVTGPDGNLWFVESTFNHTAIARMTTRGVVTEYPLGGSSTDQLQPVEIIAGPDGNLWFNVSHPSAAQGEIGRITATGSIALTSLPTGGRPNGLAKGPDGNVWFTDSGGNAVGRMTPAGGIREFALPTRTATPYGIAVGADGRMWFTEGGKLASIGVTVPEMKLSTRVVTFGPSPNVRSVGITNTGEADLKIATVGVVGPDRAMFTAVRDGCTGRSIPVNGTCRMDLSFAPGVQQGVVAAQLAITDNATASPQIVSLLAQVPDCKLPLFTSSASSSSSQGGFLSLRDGVLTDDPKGVFVTSGTQSKSLATPVLSGQLPATYDRLAQRWVPVTGQAISPDGSRYAYIDYSQPMQGQVHVVDIASGLDRTLATPGGPVGIVAFASDGIYTHGSYEGVGPGISLVNPDSGAIRPVFGDSIVHRISGQVAWTVTRNASDTLPQPGGMGPSYNEVQSRDLNTAQTTTWVYRPGSDLYVVGAANGSIVVQGRDQSSAYELVVTAPGQAQVVDVGASGDNLPFTSVPIPDGTGWWMGSVNGLYLWTPHTGAILVSELTAAPAGPCA
jgi:streptogramin lyase